MRWDELLNKNIESNYNGQVKTSIDCPRCGRKIYLNTSIILSSYPAKYSYWCSCGWSGSAHVKWYAGMEDEE